MTKFSQTYPTDLKYTEWQQISEFFPSFQMGRPPKWEKWQVINAVLYVNRTGCQWRMLPVNFPPWRTVYFYYWSWQRDGLWQQINEVLVKKVVHSASIQDGAGGLLTLQKLFDRIKHNLHNHRWCRLKLIWADGGYPSIIDEVRQRFGWILQIVKRSDDVKGFQVLPHRWVVERTFGWLGRYRRLARDYEHTTLSSESMVYIASTRRMLKLLAT